MASAPTQFKLRKLATRVGPIALVTMDNGEDWQKPNTFGEAALRSLEGVLDQLRSRDWRGLLLTGKPFVFAVGADIGEFGEITPERARLGGQAGHELFGRIRELPFISVAAINGAALGGGVEIALHCDYRTIASSVRHFACPEVFLGLIPGWGGTQLVPQLVGAEQAVEFIVENPLRQNRMLNGRQAFDAGYADALFEPVEFLDDSLAFLLDKVEEGPGKRRPAADLADVGEVCRKARSRLDGQVHGATPAPYRALDLIEGAAKLVARRGLPRRGGRAGRPPSRPRRLRPRCTRSTSSSAAPNAASGMPEVEPRRVEKVGVVGAGLMARQLALLFLRRLEVPVVMRDLTQEQVDEGIAWIRDELADLVKRGRMSEGKARFLGSIVSGGTGFDVFAGCDSRHRGGLRGDAGEEGRVRRARARRLARMRHRDEHLVAFGHRDELEPRAPRTRGRDALLQPGGGAAPRRARADTGNERRLDRDRVGGHQEAAQDRRPRAGRDRHSS